MTRPALSTSLAALVGIAFVLAGIFGFLADSDGKLFGTFQVSLVHNFLHLLFGVLGLVLARTAVGARMFLTGGGAVYVALWVVGVIGAGDWIPVNTADNWLHFLLGLGMRAAGAAVARVARPAAT